MTRKAAIFIAAGVSLAVSLAWLAYDGMVRLPRRRRQWEATHAPIADEDWALQLGLSADRKAISLVLRQTLPDCCGFSPVFIAPQTSFAELEKHLTHDGLDRVEVVMSLEDALGVSIPDKLGERLPDPGTKLRTVADWVHDLIPKWKPVVVGLRRATENHKGDQAPRANAGLDRNALQAGPDQYR